MFTRKHHFFLPRYLSLNVLEVLIQCIYSTILPIFECTFFHVYWTDHAKIDVSRKISILQVVILKVGQIPSWIRVLTKLVGVIRERGFQKSTITHYFRKQKHLHFSGILSNCLLWLCSKQAEAFKLSASIIVRHQWLDVLVDFLCIFESAAMQYETCSHKMSDKSPRN